MADEDDINFKHVKPAMCYELNEGENLASFRVTTFFLNGTNEDVTVLLRNNLPLTIHKNTNNNIHSNFFIIRTQYHFTSSDRINNTIINVKKFTDKHNSCPEEADIIQKALIEKKKDHKFDILNSYSIAIDRKVDIYELRELKYIYIPDTDHMLAIGDGNVKYPHPYSAEGKCFNEYSEHIKNKTSSGIFVELIDNENNINSRYLYACNQLLEIYNRKDLNRTSGVYVVKANNNKLNDPKLVSQFYTFDEAEKEIGLYKTKEDAMNAGNRDASVKAEVAKAEKALEEMKINSERLKRKFSDEKINQERELNEIKHKQAIEEANNKERVARLEAALEQEKRDTKKLQEELDAKKSIRNDYYESRSSQRKDDSELYKFIPLVLGVGIAVFGMTRK